MLTREEILKQMQGDKPNIIIDPFFKECLGSDSYDLHLDDKLLVYKNTVPNGMKTHLVYDPSFFKEIQSNPNSDGMHCWFETAQAYEDYCLRPAHYDPRNLKRLINPFEEKEVIKIEIPAEGLILNPDICYLGSTIEYTETHDIFPFIDGKSTIGRNFMLVHYTAGRGDRGFRGNWTLEINCHYPIVVKAGMRIGQIYYMESKGQKTTEYGEALSSHYKGQTGPTPAKALKMDDCILKYIKNRNIPSK